MQCGLRSRSAKIYASNVPDSRGRDELRGARRLVRKRAIHRDSKELSIAFRNHGAGGVDANSLAWLDENPGKAKIHREPGYCMAERLFGLLTSLHPAFQRLPGKSPATAQPERRDLATLGEAVKGGWVALQKRSRFTNSQNARMYLNRRCGRFRGWLVLLLFGLHFGFLHCVHSFQQPWLGCTFSGASATIKRPRPKRQRPSTSVETLLFQHRGEYKPASTPAFRRPRRDPAGALELQP
jgi:hypothetical protein